jgi:hypothetical protein
MDEVRIWNVARTQAQIKTNMFNKEVANNSAGLVGYYRFSENSGTATANSCTNTSGIDGTLTNGTSWANSPVQFGANSLSFDGVDDHVVSTATFNLNMNNSSFTVEAWINSGNSSANTTTERILMQWGPTWQAGGYQLVCTNTYIHFNFNGSSTGSCTYSVNWQDGNWHHVAGVFNIVTHTLYLYFDGVQRAAVSTGSNAPGALNTSLYIGGSPGVANSFASAKMDEVRVWNVARSQAEIQANMFRELNHPFNNVGTVPRLYYTFNQGIAAGTNTGLVTIIEQYLQAHGNGTLVNFGFSGSSNFEAQNNSLFVLPLQWQSFTAQRQNKDVLLQWSTAQEQNTRDFAVQHSKDGSQWQTIATIPAAGNSAGSRHYRYVHSTPAPKVNYYRIQQNDQDGRKGYSQIRAVVISATANSFELLSNPVNNKIMRLQVNAASGQTLQLLESDGRLIWTRQFTSGMHAVNLERVAAGVYILKSGSYSQKVIVQ